MTGEVFTILGARGTIGRALAASLQTAGHDVRAVERADLPAFLSGQRPAGHVINCIGLTGNFRDRPLDTAEAHVGITARCLAACRFESFLFLSSTRVYARARATHEDTPLPCLPTDASDVYTATKLAGEALCLSDPRPQVRVARLSNVYAAEPGLNTFLGQILDDGRRTGYVTFRQAPHSAKDYIGIGAIVRLLPRIAATGRHRLYNVASGHNTAHGAIAARLQAELGWRINFWADAPVLRFPAIDNTRLRAEFAPALSVLLEDLSILAAGQEAPCSQSMRQPGA